MPPLFFWDSPCDPNVLDLLRLLINHDQLAALPLYANEQAVTPSGVDRALVCPNLSAFLQEFVTELDAENLSIFSFASFVPLDLTTCARGRSAGLHDPERATLITPGQAPLLGAGGLHPQEILTRRTHLDCLSLKVSPSWWDCAMHCSGYVRYVHDTMADGKTAVW